MNIHTLTCEVGTNPITIETGKLAKLADGAVTVRCGDTIILVTAVSQTKIRPGQSWFPLSVEYKEKASAAGVFPGGYFKREGRPTEKEILTCRMTDRPLRPLFPKGYLYDTQIIAILLSADQENDADVWGIMGASLSLNMSNIPFGALLAGVRIGRIQGNWVLNPTFQQLEYSEVDIVVAGTEDAIKRGRIQSRGARLRANLRGLSCGRFALGSSLRGRSARKLLHSRRALPSPLLC